MIQPNELRIGNYIYGISDRVEVVCGVLESTVKTRVPNISKMLSSEYGDVSGIPISAEWLVKFGFTFDGHIYEASERIKELSNKDIGVKYQAYFFNRRLNRWMDCQTRVCIDYVHQLQNLYHSLTGQELIITS